MFIKYVERVPLACTECSIYYDSTSFASANFFYALQIHSIKLLPFPELSMEIKIFFKLTFKFPVTIIHHTYTMPNVARNGELKKGEY